MIGRMMGIVDSVMQAVDVGLVDAELEFERTKVGGFNSHQVLYEGFFCIGMSPKMSVLVSRYRIEFTL